MVHVLSNMQNVTISRCCFVTFCKQQQKKNIITHVHTVIVLVAVVVEGCLIKLPKTEQTAK